MTGPMIEGPAVGEVPPWIDLDALTRVLDNATAGNLYWSAWESPHTVDGQEYPVLPGPEQEAAEWARDCGLLVEDGHHLDGHIAYAPTGLGRALRAVLRGWS